MEIYKIENLSFKYPESDYDALYDISLSINSGEFITICGKSGCGKSTLLRQLKPVLTPHGIQSGEVRFKGNLINSLDLREQSEQIGFVMQSPDNQIVTDKVWHEMAFGLESLGMSTPEIRSRVAEMASFFGIQNWFYKDVSELSGGQKQLLNLASVMVMQPSVLILDEPASQLDPIAAKEFIDVLSKINKELGTTVILSEHRHEETFAVSDRVIFMDKGRIIADDKPCMIADKIKDSDILLPTAMRVYVQTGGTGKSPVTVREGREWLERQKLINIEYEQKEKITTESVVELNDLWFRYEKNLPDIIKGLTAQVHKGELYAIVGGNGTGKTTALSLISGINRPYRGKIEIKGTIGALPQNPQTLFVKKTVKLDLYEMLSDKKMSVGEKDKLISEVISLCELEHLLDRHPYDLSGGEQQRAALAKVLLMRPQILLLDEPTKGLDGHFKQRFADILNTLKASGITIIMVSHDIEFCAEYADRCAMFFDGHIVSEGEPREFFGGKSFYTTCASRMARGIINNVVLSSDIIRACGKEYEKKTEVIKELNIRHIEAEKKEEKQVKINPFKIVAGVIFAVLFILTAVLFQNKYEDNRSIIVHIITILFAGISLHCLLPRRLTGAMSEREQMPKRKLSKRTLVSILFILIAVPLTVYTGFYFLDDKKYYFISLLIILETMIPFAFVFEGRKPQPRELVIIAVLCAITVAGRAAFAVLPQFKPMIAIVIITGICFGGETGFLVGAISAFVSNFPFGQGPWTPWQMFAMGIIGFIAGVLFKKGFIIKSKVSLCVFGAFCAVVIYGGIMNPASVILWQDNPTKEMIISSFVMGIPFDLVHAASTAFFLWIAANPMVEKLERIKTKYGITE